MKEVVAIGIEKNIGVTEVKLRGQDRETLMMRWITTDGGNLIANLTETITEKSVGDTIAIGGLQVGQTGMMDRTNGNVVLTETEALVTAGDLNLLHHPC
jgi:hypothetical protein